MFKFLLQYQPHPASQPAIPRINPRPAACKRRGSRAFPAGQQKRRRAKRFVVYSPQFCRKPPRHSFLFFSDVTARRWVKVVTGTVARSKRSHNIQREGWLSMKRIQVQEPNVLFSCISSRQQGQAVVSSQFLLGVWSHVYRHHQRYAKFPVSRTTYTQNHHNFLIVRRPTLVTRSCEVFSQKKASRTCEERGGWLQKFIHLI